MSQASAAAAPLYAAHNDVMSVGNAGSPGSGTGNATSSSSISSSSTSVSGGGMGGGMGGLTASSLVTAAIGKQTLGLNYEVYSSSTQQQQPVAKSRSSVSFFRQIAANSKIPVVISGFFLKKEAGNY